MIFKCLLLNWHLTYFCNLSCKHCYSRNISCVQIGNDILRKTPDILKLLGTQVVNFGGGECLLHSLCLELAAELNDRGIMVVITSNGYPITEKKATAIKQAGVVSVCLSVDGPELIHDQNRGKKGAYKVVIEAARLLFKYDIPISVNALVLPECINEYEFHLQQIYKNMNPERITIVVPKKGPCGSEYSLYSNAAWKHLADEIKSAATFIGGQTIRVKHPILGTLLSDSGDDLEILSTNCKCGDTQFTLLPNGDLQDCPFSGKY